LSYAASREGERRAKPRPSRFVREISPEVAAQQAAPRTRPEARPQSARAEEMPDDPLFAALKTWRLEESKRKGLPAYVIFHDATLAQIAREKPASTGALRGIPGVGAVKMQRYGEAVLELVAQAG